jgi:hypothetical protein
MDILSKLEIKKILKEIEYLNSDLNYKNEIIHKSDRDFLKSVDDNLNNNKELKDIFDDKISQKIEDVIKNDSKDSDVKKINKTNINPYVKNLYRKISKQTHPDKINNKILNNIYLKASSIYNDNDIIGIYLICDELNIEYNIDTLDINMLREKITYLKNRINLIESTLSWKWYNSQDEREKNKMILKYIETQLKTIRSV